MLEMYFLLALVPALMLVLWIIWAIRKKDTTTGDELSTSEPANKNAACGDSHETVQWLDAKPRLQCLDPDFLVRAPLYNASRQVIGYQLALLNDSKRSAKWFLSRIAPAIESLSNLSLAGNHKIFLKTPSDVLFSDQITLLPTKNFVLMIDHPKGEIDQRLESRLIALRQMDYSLGFIWSQKSRYQAVPFSSFKYLKIRLQDTSHKQLQKLVRDDFRGGGHRLILSGVTDKAGFDSATEFYPSAMSGDYFGARQAFKQRSGCFNPQGYLRVVNHLQGSADLLELEEQIKRDPVLTYRLLRYINSPFYGIKNPVESVRQALTLLGPKEVTKWKHTVVLSQNLNKSCVESVNFLRDAMFRARFMELLARHVLGASHGDKGFFTGLFSLMPALMDMSIEKISQEIVLPDDVFAALTGHDGALSDLLALAQVPETQDKGLVETMAKKYGISLDQLSAAVLEGIDWSHGLFAVDH